MGLVSGEQLSIDVTCPGGVPLTTKTVFGFPATTINQPIFTALVHELSVYIISPTLKLPLESTSS